MADRTSQLPVSSVSLDIGDDGIAAAHPFTIDFPHRVATAQPGDRRRNTIKDLLLVIGCCTVPDGHFDFDSSFVRPDAQAAMIKLAALRDALTDPPLAGSPPGAAGTPPPLSIFGHADPVGTDAYNSTLSRRRASAIYGMLIRDAAIWERLINTPSGGDVWGKSQFQTMQDFVAERTGEQIGRPGVVTGAERRRLILAYMDAVCVRRNPDQSESPFSLKRDEDFLARGAGTNAKGDVQGCSRFNPTLVISDARMALLERQNDKHASRNAANEINRRVIAFLFKPGSQVDPARWPCPHVQDERAVERCRDRFWSDATARRKADPVADRLFHKDRRTFACRWYHGIAQNSPCEGVHKQWVIRILTETPRFDKTNTFRLAPLPQRRWAVIAGDAANAPVLRGKTDDNGIFRLPVFDEKTKMTLKLEVAQFLAPEGVITNDPRAGTAGRITGATGAAPADREKEERDEANFAVFTLDAGALLPLDTGALDRPDAGGPQNLLAFEQRLFNLGYGAREPGSFQLEELLTATRQFQRNERLAKTDGTPNKETGEKLLEEHEPPLSSVAGKASAAAPAAGGA
jgi:hypothetical protein